MKLVKVILSLSLLVTTSVSKANEDTIVQKNQKAPFMGVLVSEPRYKFYTEQSKIAEFHLNNPCVDTDIEESNKDTVIALVGGLVIGMLVGYSVGSK